MTAAPVPPPRGRRVLGESVRVALLGAAAAAVMLPFFTGRLIGGRDARWYAYVLQDFLEQLRAGHFPVFIGQGRLIWNGGVHPFRSAPLYLDIAAAGDFLTLRSLGVLALQHFEAILVAVAGALGFYAAGVALAPRRRWEVLALALLYVGAPAWLGVLYRADAYMTFTALAVLPLALYGNARLLLSEGGRGGGILAAGLALAWMTHPPTALLATLATLLLQGGGWLLGDRTLAFGRSALFGALLFAGFGAYYFAGMSELPRPPGSGLPALGQFGGFALVLAGLGNAVLMRRGWAWLVLLLPGGALLWLVCIPWFWWMAATVVLAALVAAAAPRLKFDPSRRAAEILLPCLIAAAGLVQACLGPARPDRNISTLQGLAVNLAQMKPFFPFVPGRVFHPDANLEPGVGTWIVLAMLACAFFRPRALALKLFFFVGLLFTVALVPVPWISDFLVGYLPDYVVNIISFPLLIRILPVMAAFILMGGVVWLATAPEGGGGRRLGPLVLLGVAVGLCGWQAAQFVDHGWRITSDDELTRQPFYTENLVLDRFNYDLLPVPRYFSSGATDPRLEFRLLDAERRVTFDPDLAAKRMEGAGATVVRLDSVQVPENRRWLRLTPGLTVAPGEQLLLRFEFDPIRAYGGVLVFRSEHGYREYQLPNDGLGYGFGVGPEWSHVISLWNSGKAPEHYTFDIPAGYSPNPGLEGYFATMTVSHYDATRGPLRMDSLDPCRVLATVDRPGWLETPRVFIPGYVATVDGAAAAIAPSPEHLVMVPLAPGRHVVELRYRGTRRVWLALLVSLATWCGWLAWSCYRLLRPVAEEPFFPLR